MGGEDSTVLKCFSEEPSPPFFYPAFKNRFKKKIAGRVAQVVERLLASLASMRPSVQAPALQKKIVQEGEKEGVLDTGRD
jgi:hypothetical protein